MLSEGRSDYRVLHLKQTNTLKPSLSRSDNKLMVDGEEVQHLLPPRSHQVRQRQWLDDGHHEFLMQPRWSLGQRVVCPQKAVLATVDDIMSSRQETTRIDRKNCHVI